MTTANKIHGKVISQINSHIVSQTRLTEYIIIINMADIIVNNNPHNNKNQL